MISKNIDRVVNNFVKMVSIIMSLFEKKIDK